MNNRQLQQGITLIDLVLTISILSLLLGTALPAFDELLDKNKVNAQLMQLRSTLQLARKIAITEREKVTVCPTSDNLNCSSDWSQGYMAFIDHNEDRHFNNTDQLAYSHQIRDEHLQVKWRAFGVRSSFQWHETGITNHQNGTFYLCFKEKPKLSRALIITKAGRIRISKDTDGDEIHEGANDKNLNCN
ncbi:GspH/FimT family pseudopilin [Aliikangiella marina]|nr:GspH/FimT family protein [Aliikangiella marina]